MLKYIALWLLTYYNSVNFLIICRKTLSSEFRYSGQDGFEKDVMYSPAELYTVSYFHYINRIPNNSKCRLN
jgi:hypothetical protein